MSSLCSDDDSQHFSGWQEIYTDFDSWICKFSKCWYRRSSQHFSPIESSATLKSIHQSNTTDKQLISTEDMIAEGFILRKLNETKKSRDPVKKELGPFLNITKDGAVFVNYDYVLIKLINGDGKYFCQYTRSKLLLCFICTFT